MPEDEKLTEKPDAKKTGASSFGCPLIILGFILILIIVVLLFL